MKDSKDSEFYQGFALALASLVRLFDYPTVAVDIMKSNGVDIDDLRKARVEKYDFSVLDKAWKENP